MEVKNINEEQASKLEKILSDIQLDFKESNFVEDFKQKLDIIVKEQQKINKYLDEKTKNTPKIFKKLHRKYLLYRLNK